MGMLPDGEQPKATYMDKNLLLQQIRAFRTQLKALDSFFELLEGVYAAPADEPHQLVAGPPKCAKCGTIITDALIYTPAGQTEPAYACRCGHTGAL